MSKSTEQYDKMRQQWWDMFNQAISDGETPDVNHGFLHSDPSLLAEVRSQTALIHSLKGEVESLRRELLLLKTGVLSLLERD